MSPTPSIINPKPKPATGINIMPRDSYITPKSPATVQATNLLGFYSYKYIKYSKPSTFASSIS